MVEIADENVHEGGMADSVCSLVISRAVLLAYRDTNLERECYRNLNASKLCSPYEIGAKDINGEAECAAHELGRSPPPSQLETGLRVEFGATRLMPFG